MGCRKKRGEDKRRVGEMRERGRKKGEKER